jgi:arylsulfatase
LDAHDPYLAASKFRTQPAIDTYLSNWQLYKSDKTSRFPVKIHNQLKTAYEDAVRYSDRFLQGLLDNVNQQETVTIVHADHGESLGEHDTYGHRHNIFEENIHVPLVVSGPGKRFESGSQCTRPMSLRKIPDLIAKVAKGEANKSALLDLTEDYVMSKSILADKWAVRGKESKLIVNKSKSASRTYRITELKEEESTPNDVEALTTEFINWMRTEQEIEVAQSIGQQYHRNTSDKK